MKKIKKLWAIGLAVLFMLCMNMSLVGCEKTGPIPNGHYGSVHSIPEEPLPDNYFMRTTSNIRRSYGWVIDGDTAEEWLSGSCKSKAKIVEKDGEIYFEAYIRSNDVYLVEYNESRKSITLFLVVVPS